MIEKSQIMDVQQVCWSFPFNLLDSISSVKECHYTITEVYFKYCNLWQKNIIWNKVKKKNTNICNSSLSDYLAYTCYYFYSAISF